MVERAPAPQPPLFNFGAYSPAEIKRAVEKTGVKKANLPVQASLMLAVVGGGSIGLGALYYTIVACDPALTFAIERVLGGLKFFARPGACRVGGAELFTGNNLIAMAWASSKISTAQMLRNWVIVYFGNLIGSLELVALVFLSHHLDMNGGRIGLSILNTAVAKIQPTSSPFSSRACCATCSSAWGSGLPMQAGRSPTKFSLSSCRSPPSWRPVSSIASPTCIFCRRPGCWSRLATFRPISTLRPSRYPGLSTISFR